MKQSDILITTPGADYELIDSGLGEKLERFGDVILSRPDPQALWNKNDSALWKATSAIFLRSETQGNWSLSKELKDRWEISIAGLKFWIKLTAFKHVGIFPEQSPNWVWLKEKVQSAKCKVQSDSKDIGQSSASNSASSAKESPNPVSVSLTGDSTELEVLNLFGYTGGATLACSQAGAKVVHVDGSKVALTWARENAELSGLGKNPIRWILDDARTFVRRELKRDRRYDGIILDPPAFGHGPENELWKIEEHFLPLVDECMKILKDKPLFFLINGYSAGYSALAYENILMPLVAKFGGKIQIGELAIQESAGAKRLLPSGIFARWEI